MSVATQPECPINRDTFPQKATSLPIVINGVPLIAEVKEFSTGSLGWYCGGKLTITVDGKPVKVQVGLNLTIVGSKELPR
jgi:hypothetical protein